MFFDPHPFEMPFQPARSHTTSSYPPPCANGALLGSWGRARLSRAPRHDPAVGLSSYARSCGRDVDAYESELAVAAASRARRNALRRSASTALILAIDLLTFLFLSSRTRRMLLLRARVCSVRSTFRSLYNTYLRAHTAAPVVSTERPSDLRVDQYGRTTVCADPRNSCAAARLPTTSGPRWARPYASRAACRKTPRARFAPAAPPRPAIGVPRTELR